MVSQVRNADSRWLAISTVGAPGPRAIRVMVSTSRASVAMVDAGQHVIEDQQIAATDQPPRQGDTLPLAS